MIRVQMLRPAVSGERYLVSVGAYVRVQCLFAGADRDREPFHNAIIATHTAQLMVYKETTLVWSARHHVQPIALAVAQFGCVSARSCVILVKSGHTESKARQNN